MRNLHKRLSLSCNASIEEIRSAIANSSDVQLRRDATCVLLDERRRAAYDQVFSTLVIIAHLRENLLLQNSTMWQEPIRSDFKPQFQSSRKSTFASLKKKHSVGDESEQSPFRDAMNWVLSSQYGTNMIGLALILAVVWIVGLVGDCGDNTARQHVDQRTEQPSTTSQEKYPPTIPQSSLPKADQQIAQKSPDATNFVQPEPMEFIPIEPPQQPLPRHGWIQKLTRRASIAPFRIQTIGPEHFFLKLSDANSGKDVLRVFVRGGLPLEIEVPLGNYTIKYATGEKWYGYEHLFGRSTIYSKADETFSFERRTESIRGYTLTLYPVSHGNLETTKISADEF